MKKLFNWQTMLGLLLISLSVIVYAVHYLIFRDLHHIFIYLLGDIGFVFLEVFLVTLVLHRLLNYREKQALLKKLNMVIGVFFSEVGTELLKRLSLFNSRSSAITRKLIIEQTFSAGDFIQLRRQLRDHESEFNMGRGDLEGLKTFLLGQRGFLLDLLRNPSLLEHESFTDLLWAVFHLTEELHYRKDLRELPQTDYSHLAKDAQRAYRRLILAWLEYMRHLKEDYPYLFSLALRTNPFDEKISVELLK